jgi:hypothetical protein
MNDYSLHESTETDIFSRRICAKYRWCVLFTRISSISIFYFRILDDRYVVRVYGKKVTFTIERSEIAAWAIVVNGSPCY